MKNIIYTILLFLPFCVYSQLDRSIIPSPGDAPQINIKDSKVFKTENGITVIISENHKIPKVSFSLLMGADPILEKDKTGLSEMTGSLIMSGTNSKTKDKLDSEIDYIGASISANSMSPKIHGAEFQKIVNKKITNYYSPFDDVLKAAHDEKWVDSPIGYRGASGDTCKKYHQKQVKPQNHRFASYAKTIKSFP